jgi:hypothetical protein
MVTKIAALYALTDFGPVSQAGLFVWAQRIRLRPSVVAKTAVRAIMIISFAESVVARFLSTV